jgi:hypothetical protein
MLQRPNRHPGYINLLLNNQTVEKTLIVLYNYNNSQMIEQHTMPFHIGIAFYQYNIYTILFTSANSLFLNA